MSCGVCAQASVAAATAAGEEEEPGLDPEESTNFMAMPPTTLGETNLGVP